MGRTEKTVLTLEKQSKTGSTLFAIPSASFHYVNVSVLIKFSLKNSVFYLNYHKNSI